MALVKARNELEKIRLKFEESSDNIHGIYQDLELFVNLYGSLKFDCPGDIAFFIKYLEAIFEKCTTSDQFKTYIRPLKRLLGNECSLEFLREFGQGIIDALCDGIRNPNKAVLIDFYIHMIHKTRRANAGEGMSVLSLQDMEIFKLMDEICGTTDTAMKAKETQLFQLLVPIINPSEADFFFPANISLQDVLIKFSRSEVDVECFLQSLEITKQHVSVELTYFKIGKEFVVGAKSNKENAPRTFVEFICNQGNIAFWKTAELANNRILLIENDNILEVSSKMIQNNEVELGVKLRKPIEHSIVGNLRAKVIRVRFPWKFIQRVPKHDFLQHLFANLPEIIDETQECDNISVAIRGMVQHSHTILSSSVPIEDLSLDNENSFTFETFKSMLDNDKTSSPERTNSMEHNSTTYTQPIRTNNFEAIKNKATCNQTNKSMRQTSTTLQIYDNREYRIPSESFTTNIHAENASQTRTNKNDKNTRVATSVSSQESTRTLKERQSHSSAQQCHGSYTNIQMKAGNAKNKYNNNVNAHFLKKDINKKEVWNEIVQSRGQNVNATSFGILRCSNQSNTASSTKNVERRTLTDKEIAKANVSKSPGHKFRILDNTIVTPTRKRTQNGFIDNESVVDWNTCKPLASSTMRKDVSVSSTSQPSVLGNLCISNENDRVRTLAQVEAHVNVNQSSQQNSISGTPNKRGTPENVELSREKVNDSRNSEKKKSTSRTVNVSDNELAHLTMLSMDKTEFEISIASTIEDANCFGIPKNQMIEQPEDVNLLMEQNSIDKTEFEISIQSTIEDANCFGIPKSQMKKQPQDLNLLMEVKDNAIKTERRNVNKTSQQNSCSVTSQKSQKYQKTSAEKADESKSYANFAAEELHLKMKEKNKKRSFNVSNNEVESLALLSLEFDSSDPSANGDAKCFGIPKNQMEEQPEDVNLLMEQNSMDKTEFEISIASTIEDANCFGIPKNQMIEQPEDVNLLMEQNSIDKTEFEISIQSTIEDANCFGFPKNQMKEQPQDQNLLMEVKDNAIKTERRNVNKTSQQNSCSVTSQKSPKYQKTSAEKADESKSYTNFSAKELHLPMKEKNKKRSFNVSNNEVESLALLSLEFDSSDPSANGDAKCFGIPKNQMKEQPEDLNLLMEQNSMDKTEFEISIPSTIEDANCFGIPKNKMKEQPQDLNLLMEVKDNAIKTQKSPKYQKTNFSAEGLRLPLKEKNEKRAFNVSNNEIESLALLSLEFDSSDPSANGDAKCLEIQKQQTKETSHRTSEDLPETWRRLSEMDDNSIEFEHTLVSLDVSLDVCVSQKSVESAHCSIDKTLIENVNQSSQQLSISAASENVELFPGKAPTSENVSSAEEEQLVLKEKMKRKRSLRLSDDIFESLTQLSVDNAAAAKSQQDSTSVTSQKSQNGELSRKKTQESKSSANFCGEEENLQLMTDNEFSTLQSMDIPEFDISEPSANEDAECLEIPKKPTKEIRHKTSDDVPETQRMLVEQDDISIETQEQILERNTLKEKNKRKRPLRISQDLFESPTQLNEDISKMEMRDTSAESQQDSTSVKSQRSQNVELSLEKTQESKSSANFSGEKLNLLPKKKNKKHSLQLSDNEAEFSTLLSMDIPEFDISKPSANENAECLEIPKKPTKEIRHKTSDDLPETQRMLVEQDDISIETQEQVLEGNTLKEKNKRKRPLRLSDDIFDSSTQSNEDISKMEMRDASAKSQQDSTSVTSQKSDNVEVSREKTQESKSSANIRGDELNLLSKEQNIERSSNVSDNEVDFPTPLSLDFSEFDISGPSGNGNAKCLEIPKKSPKEIRHKTSDDLPETQRILVEKNDVPIETQEQVLEGNILKEKNKRKRPLRLSDDIFDSPTQSNENISKMGMRDASAKSQHDSTSVTSQKSQNVEVSWEKTQESQSSAIIPGEELNLLPKKKDKKHSFNVSENEVDFSTLQSLDISELNISGPSGNGNAKCLEIPKKPTKEIRHKTTKDLPEKRTLLVEMDDIPNEFEEHVLGGNTLKGKNKRKRPLRMSEDLFEPPTQLNEDISKMEMRDASAKSQQESTSVKSHKSQNVELSREKTQESKSSATIPGDELNLLSKEQSIERALNVSQNEVEFSTMLSLDFSELDISGPSGNGNAKCLEIPKKPTNDIRHKTTKDLPEKRTMLVEMDDIPNEFEEQELGGNTLKKKNKRKRPLRISEDLFEFPTQDISKMRDASAKSPTSQNVQLSGKKAQKSGTSQFSAAVNLQPDAKNKRKRSLHISDNLSDSSALVSEAISELDISVATRKKRQPEHAPSQHDLPNASNEDANRFGKKRKRKLQSDVQLNETEYLTPAKQSVVDKYNADKPARKWFRREVRRIRLNIARPPQLDPIIAQHLSNFESISTSAQCSLIQTYATMEKAMKDLTNRLTAESF